MIILESALKNFAVKVMHNSFFLFAVNKPAIKDKIFIFFECVGSMDLYWLFL